MVVGKKFFRQKHQPYVGGPSYAADPSVESATKEKGATVTMGKQGQVGTYRITRKIH